MPRRFTENRLIIATHNKGKLAEFRALLGPHVKVVQSAGDLGLPEPAETGATFEENAVLKARAAAQASGFPALADDSGLCVNALGGKPSLHTARWCGPERDPMVGMTRVNDELADSADRSAYFICVLALAWPDGHVEVVEGRCLGEIVWPPRGDGGHGFDPCFKPEGETRTFGEMSAAEKHPLSHRGKAMEKMITLFEE